MTRKEQILVTIENAYYHAWKNTFFDIDKMTLLHVKHANPYYFDIAPKDRDKYLTLNGFYYSIDDCLYKQQDLINKIIQYASNDEITHIRAYEAFLQSKDKYVDENIYMTLIYWISTNMRYLYNCAFENIFEEMWSKFQQTSSYKAIFNYLINCFLEEEIIT